MARTIYLFSMKCDNFVSVPINHIKMEYLHPNGTWIPVFNGGRGHMQLHNFRLLNGLRCIITVKGGSVEPSVKISVDRLDIIHRFTKTIERIWQEKVAKRRTTERGYRVTYEYITYHPNRKENRKWVYCKASVPEFPRKMYRIQLNITCKSCIIIIVLCIVVFSLSYFKPKLITCFHAVFYIP